MKDGKVLKGKTYEKVFAKAFPEAYDEIKGPWFKERLYIILHSIESHPLCPVCNNPLPLRSFTKGFQHTCSRECASKLQSIDTQWSEKQKDAKADNVKQRLKSKYPGLDVEAISIDGKTRRLVKGYCKHGDVLLASEGVLDKMLAKGICLCEKCREEAIGKIEYSNSELETFQDHFREFRASNSHGFNREWFIKYHPREYKMIIDWSSHIEGLSLMQRCVMFQNKWKEIPTCRHAGCTREVKWAPSGSEWLPYCQEHVNCNHWQSAGELQIRELIASLGIEFEANNRSVIGQELDIWIPSKNVAIEFNGIWYHSEMNKSKEANSEKWRLCKEKGIQLVTVWEDDWNDESKRMILTDIIKSKLGICSRVFARKCKLEKIDLRAASLFFESAHYQGKCLSKFQYALEHEDEIVAMMTFGKSRFNEDAFELIRYACKPGTIVIGGAERLFKAFVEDVNPSTVVSYANCDYSNGLMYRRIGFEEKGWTLDYWWCKDGKKHSRYQFMKQHLKKMWPDSKGSEDDIMHEHGFYKLYGTGNLKMVWRSRYS